MKRQALLVFEPYPRGAKLIAFKFTPPAFGKGVWPVGGDTFVVPKNDQTYDTFEPQVHQLMEALTLCRGLDHSYCRLHPDRFDVMWVRGKVTRKKTARKIIGIVRSIFGDMPVKNKLPRRSKRH
jgi:hypothetical protein